MSVAILPLAITMMAGPQIMSAFVLVTSRSPVRPSLAFLAGVALATTVGLVIAMGISALLGNAFGVDSSDDGTLKTVQIVLVLLLVAVAVKSYLGRATSEPPKWLDGLLTATPRKAFTTGLLSRT